MDHSPRSTTASASATRMVDVLVPVALDQTYSYRVPRGMELKAGDLVGVPLGPREVLAVVWAENANPDPRLHNRLKDVSEKLDIAPIGVQGFGRQPAFGAQIGLPARYLAPNGLVGAVELDRFNGG